MRLFDDSDMTGTENLRWSLRAGDVYVSKQTPSNIRDMVGEAVHRDEFYRPQNARYKGVPGEKPVVGRVMLSGNDDSHVLIKTQVRHVRCAVPPPLPVLIPGRCNWLGLACAPRTPLPLTLPKAI